VTTGQPLTYTLKTTNTGAQNATSVTVKDPLPASAVFGSVHTTRGRCARTVTTTNTDGTITCHLGILPTGATATVRITITPAKAGTLTDKGAVIATNVTKDADDSATATVTVLPT